MKRIGLLFLLCCLFAGVRAQDFSIDDLLRLRLMNMSDFETAVMAKGYEFGAVAKEYDRVVAFNKGDRIIGMGYMKNPHSESIDTVIYYRTRSTDEFKRLQAQRREDPAHPNQVHLLNDDEYITHVYVDGKICLHFRTMQHLGNLYEIKVFPDNTDKYYHYSSLNGDIDY